MFLLNISFLKNALNIIGSLDRNLGFSDDRVTFFVIVDLCLFFKKLYPLLDIYYQ